MGNIINPVAKKVRTYIVLASMLYVFYVFVNFFFAIFLGLLGIPVNIFTLNIFDIFGMGMFIIVLYIPFLIFTGFIGGAIIEVIAPILVKMR